MGVALFVAYDALVITSFWAVLAACAYELLFAVWLALRLLLGTSLGSTWRSAPLLTFLLARRQTAAQQNVEPDVQ